FHDGMVISAYGVGNTGFEMKDNVMGHNLYGIFGTDQSPGMASINVFFPRGRFRKNVIAGADDSKYPIDNFYPPRLDDLKFVNRAGGDYRLSPESRYRGRATDGKDPGCDFDQLNAALKGA
ncbi:MAG TPA: hypothetical protein VGX92_00275, partial [Pyrinomonadaceae bacterium]|nr:hypothetical protein [Pyrinomonadaceae bacterium]